MRRRVIAIALAVTILLAGEAGTAATAAPTPAAARSCGAPPVPARARQALVVAAHGTTYAQVTLKIERAGGRWQCVRIDMRGRVGRSGVRRGRTEGDGSTPAGVFRLGTMTAPGGQRFQFFGNGQNPGVPGRWRQVRPRDCWNSTPYQRLYNLLTRRTRARCGDANEFLPDYQQTYSRAALIGYNMGPNRSGDEPGEHPRGSAIFLHRHSWAGGRTRATSGCVSLSGPDLDFVLRRLRPGRAWFVIRN